MKLTAPFLLLLVACSEGGRPQDPDPFEPMDGSGGAGGSPMSPKPDASLASAGGSGGAAGSGGSGGSAGVPDAAASPDANAADRVSAWPDANAAAEAGMTAAFECSMFLGPNVTGEWFDAGFETIAENGKWQVKAPHLSFVDYWADPNHAVWRESGCARDFSPCETRSKCAGNRAPDRIVFVTQVGQYLATSQAVWEQKITAAIKTIRAKYPSVRHIELMTFVRSPEGQNCGNETTVSPNLDKAHQALAAASGGTITVAPRFSVPRCDLFGSRPHFTGAGNRYVAEMMGKHYK